MLLGIVRGGAAMASRLFRADWYRACRLSRPQKSVGGNALSLEPRRRDSIQSASRTNSTGGYSTSGKHLLGLGCSTLAANSGGSADTLGRSTSSSSIDSVNLVTARLRYYDGCWRGGWRGGLCSSQQGHQQAGRRFLSTRRGKAGGQT